MVTELLWRVTTPVKDQTKATQSSQINWIDQSCKFKLESVRLLRVFLAKITGVTVITGEEMIARRMVYVIEGKSCVMSMATRRDLGCVQWEFSEVGRFSGAVADLRAMTSTGHRGADGGSHVGEVVR